jgi:DNA helicase-2/ATP-dependent DNA helicase PcrA
MTQRIKLSGPPGTGKTTKLISYVEQLISQGVAPDDIMLTTFTRAGAKEAQDRACAKFNLTPARLPYFRTLHSICYSLIPENDILQPSDWFNLAHTLGLSFSVSFKGEDGVLKGSSKGDQLMGLWSLARATKKSIHQILNEREMFPGMPVINLPELEHFIGSVTAYKQSLGKIDYTDMLEIWLERGHHPHVSYVIADEGQDLSKLQWDVLECMAEKAKEFTVAGDDDQAIHEWNGASPLSLIDMECDQHIVLPQSYRIPRKIHDLAESITKKISRRTVKEYQPRTEEGEINIINHLDQLDLDEGTWLLLARNLCFLEEYSDLCYRKGVLFLSDSTNGFNRKLFEAIKSWRKLLAGEAVPTPEARDLYKLMSQRDRVKRGFKVQLERTEKETVTIKELQDEFGLLVESPWNVAFDMIGEQDKAFFKKLDDKGALDSACRIRISTIHGAKGAESQNVVLRTDMTYRSFQSYLQNPDPEHRVFYVGATRASEKLFIYDTNNSNAYPLR